jgi:hypothetical protein
VHPLRERFRRTEAHACKAQNGVGSPSAEARLGAASITATTTSTLRKTHL